MKISLCTTCMNRVKHLKDTLLQNLANNPDMEGLEVEFVVLNYNSRDSELDKDDPFLDPVDMHEWMTTDPDMVEAIKSGRVVYARTEDPKTFHMSHAKNMAHRLATGDVVCNVDADNFTGEGFAAFLAEAFSKNPDIVINPSHGISKRMPEGETGFFGRVAISRQRFMGLGGYDEDYQGWGEEDTDFLRRAKLSGAHHVRFEQLDFLQVIPHDNEARVSNMVSTEAEKTAELSRVDNMRRSNSIIEKFEAVMHRLPTLLYKPISANSGAFFGTGRYKKD